MIEGDGRDDYMMMTDEWITIIEKAEELTDMLLASEAAAEYRQSYNNVYSNHELTQNIRTFTNMKDRYEEVQRFGKYHPDYQTVMKNIRVQKRELDLNEKVAALRLAENDLQEIFDEISLLIGKSVSDTVKVPTGNSFFSSSSCSSGCGSGGSCSCSA